MPIPDLCGSPHKYWLPPGVHECTIAEIESTFLYNDTRKKVWRYFIYVIDRMRDLGLTLPAVLIDGSFVTGRESPDDVDAVSLIPPNDLLAMLTNSPDAAVLKFILGDPHQARRIFGVHLFVAKDQAVLDDLQETFTKGLGGKGLRPPDPVRDPPGLVVPPEKGILKVDFSNYTGTTGP